MTERNPLHKTNYK